MLVLDTSAALAALLPTSSSSALVARLAADGDLHAPHLIDIELLHALRRLNRRGEVSTERAEAVREEFDDLAVVRYPHVHLLDRIWALRDTITAYDAAFVALSEALNVPLVTVDARLAGATGHAATIESF